MPMRRKYMFVLPVFIFLMPAIGLAHLVEHRSYSEQQLKSIHMLSAKDAEIRHFECVKGFRRC